MNVELKKHLKNSSHIYVTDMKAKLPYMIIDVICSVKFRLHLMKGMNVRKLIRAGLATVLLRKIRPKKTDI